MSVPLLIRNIGQLLTLRGAAGPRRGAELRELGIVDEGAVLTSDGKIVSAGPASEVESLPAARAAQEIDAQGRVVMPGFVDSHTHLVFGPVPGKVHSDDRNLAAGHLVADPFDLYPVQFLAGVACV